MPMQRLLSPWTWIPPGLSQMLDSTDGPAQAPIRSEIFGYERFAQHGRSLGETHRAAKAGFGQGSFYPRLRSNIRTLRAAHQYIAEQAQGGHDLSPAAEWLVDNFHLIEGQLQEIREGLPSHFYRSLPVLLDPPLAHLPRIYGVAWAFVAHTDGAFDEALLVHFINAYQEQRELTQGELWALPTTLRVVLVENLRRLADRVAAHKAARGVANLCADRIDTLSVHALQTLSGHMSRRGVGQIFMVQLAQNLLGRRSGPLDTGLARVRQWLQQALPDLMSLQAQHNADQTADNLSVGNAITSLRQVGAADWSDIVTRTSLVMRAMLTSPVFHAEDPHTRDTTLHAIERLSAQSGLGEAAVARCLLERMQLASGPCALACHWLQGDGRPELENALGLGGRASLHWIGVGHLARLPMYLLALLVFTGGLVAWLLAHASAAPPAWTAGAAWPVTVLASLVALGLWLPASETVVALVNRLISESVKPHHLPRFAFEQGIPPQQRVLVVVPCMLSQHSTILELTHRLHLHHLANQEPHAQFALLSDWPDAPTARTDQDDLLLDTARQAIAALNLRHPAVPDTPARFLLLHRTRSHSTTQQCWMGWERKRGKLEQLLAFMATDLPNPFVDLGAMSHIAPDTPHVLTLDSDTQLPPGRLRALVGVAAHPQNQPLLDATGRRVVSGYGILQPRLLAPLPTRSEDTAFTWLMSSRGGMDPYSAMSSDVYQDVFSEGSFTGKGLLNVAAVHAVLHQRMPAETVLSHDLLEGSLVRCAVVSDITLVETEPNQPEVSAGRLHRWTRGDWQLLPLLLQPASWPMNGINRWKLIDNLRRSLVAPASVGLLGLSAWGVGLTPEATLGLVFAAHTAGPLMGAAAGLLPSRRGFAWRRYRNQATQDVARALLGGVWHMSQLLRQAIDHVDALTRTLYRLFISRRRLLEWTTAATLQERGRPHLFAALFRQPLGPVLAAVGLLALAWGNSVPPWPVLLMLLLWVMAPFIGWQVGQPWRRTRPGLTARQAAHLHHVARDTWRLFERVVDADNHHLPPDNLQTSPTDMVAHRTSPTNIGLYLLSAACARQFGWLGTQDLLDRLEATLHTLDQLPRHEGHFLNWIDTSTLQALAPRYVSTVDSGNLSAHLLTVAQACLALASDPLAPEACARAILAARERLVSPGRSAPNPDHATDPHAWWQADLETTLASAQRDQEAHRSGLTPLATRRLRDMAQRLQAMAWAADFRFLYHPKRHLFHIGFRIEDQVLDPAFYDLLASESRMTSLLAIAKGDVPAAHWSALGRPFFAAGSRAGLRSWSGSMFEYLMPGLVLTEPHGSTLREAGEAALAEQMDYLQHQHMPWGMSESAYAGRDHSLAYQYAPQGVPRLALRRTPVAELVVAPYATALALQVNAPAACANLMQLEALSARGQYGFCEALDFTPSRQTHGGRCMRVHTYMAHHQGMSIVSLANVLLEHVAQRWGMADAHIEAVQLLLHERPPRLVPALHHLPPRLPTQAQMQRPTGLSQVLTPGAQSLEPTLLLSNGRYSLSLRPNGGGWSRWGQTGITRWRDDALRDAHGSFVYLRLDEDQSPVSVTRHPAPDPRANYQATFHTDRVIFDAHWPALHAQTTVWVSPEDDIECRRVVLTNSGQHTLEVEVLSAFEVTLAPQAADEAHPAFSNLFVQAEWLDQQQALVFARTPRLPAERHIQAAHFITEVEGQVHGTRLQTDRQLWLGRNHAASGPLAQMQDAPAGSGPLPTGLDPVSVLAVRLTVPPGGQAQVTFACAASDQASTLRAVVDKYRQPTSVERSSLMSATLATIQSRPHHLRPEFLPTLQALTTALVFTLPKSLPVPPRQELLNPALVPHCDRRLLWSLALSGERPLILVTVGAMQGLGLLRTLGQALHEWTRCGLPCDVVILSSEPASYQMPLHRELLTLREDHESHQRGSPSSAVTGLHVHRIEDLSPEQVSTLHQLACVTLNADGRPLHHHIRTWLEQHNSPQRRASQLPRSWHHAVPRAVQAHRHATVPQVPQGRFSDPGARWMFEVGADLRPSRPWVNVLSNEGFGTQVTEAGGGHTWAINSRLNQLTPWSNDPVGDPPAEWIMVEDRRSQEVWSISPSAWGDPALTYQVNHCQGATTISHRRGALAVIATWCVDAHTSVKQVHLTLVNHGSTRQHLRLVAMVEWQMGEHRSHRATTLTTRSALPHQDPSGSGGVALTCTQTNLSGGFGLGTAFLAMPVTNDPDPDGPDWTCDRREFFDSQGQWVLPQRMDQQCGLGLDPCAALARRITLLPGQQLEQVFLLGYGATPAQALLLAAEATTLDAHLRQQQAEAQWRELEQACEVRTPDKLFDALVNHWLLYQTVSSRLWAKAGYYQAGGATGFRDQLQDTMALAWARPDMLKDQIVLAASRQFEEGDVQHWWHAPTGAGVRTHFSDDLLWLPLACTHHRRCVGETGLLDTQVAFLQGPAIPDGAEDSYTAPQTSDQVASVYEHAARAIDHSLRTGVHGLPLMGTGDWNDGMNRVGHEGKGESVWLAWLLCTIATDWIPLALSRGDSERAHRWQTALQGWQAALQGPAWDGEWYTRAFFDDGSPLGSHLNVEARMDLIAQAWAVLSHSAPPERQRQAMAAAETQLVNPANGLIQLLAPPLKHAVPHAGYIQAYPPGVRENGGQYAHAGVWGLMAAAQLARDLPASDAARDTPYRWFTYLSPAHRAQHPRWGAAYGLEPYAMAGDVYSHPPYEGRGGWSWYTGAAGWLHRAAVESIFGLEQEAHTLCLRPCLPSHWDRAHLTLRQGGRSMSFTLMRCGPDEVVHELTAQDATMLRPGEALAWTALPHTTRFVVPLLPQ